MATRQPLYGDHYGGWVGDWSPGIGDPTIVGWVTVVAYFVAAYFTWRAYRRLDRPVDRAPPGARSRLTTCIFALLFAFVGARKRLLATPLNDRLRTLWLLLTVFLVLLGINKQLDLQTALTEWARMLAIDQGWYEQRRQVQLAFILAVALTGLIAFRAVILLASGELRRFRPVLGGVLVLTSFVSIRAASFHHIDRLLGSDIGGFRMNWIIELGGIAFTAVGAYRQGEPSPGAEGRPAQQKR